MKLSIHTMMTDPGKWSFPYLESVGSFLDAADEVVVVDGGSKVLDENPSIKNMLAVYGNEVRRGKLKIISLPWPWDFGLEEYAHHYNAGLRACTGDWALRCDIDYLIHETQVEDLYKKLESMTGDQAVFAATLEKLQIMTREVAYRKSRLPVAIHKAVVGSDVEYGVQMDVDAALDDWSLPVVKLGQQVNAHGVPIGVALPSALVRATGVDMWNYDTFFRTAEMQKTYFARSAKSWRKRVNENWGASDADAWRVFTEQAKARWQRKHIPLTLEKHPRRIRAKLEVMTPDQFGFDNWGLRPNTKT